MNGTRRLAVIGVITILVGPALAGCIGSDDPPAEPVEPLDEPSPPPPPMPAPVLKSGRLNQSVDPTYLALAQPVSGPSCPRSSENCHFHPFTTERNVSLTARLTWAGETNDVDLLLRTPDGDTIAESTDDIPASPAGQSDQPLEEVQVDLGPGDYVLVVAALIVTTQDTYSLEGKFQPLDDGPPGDPLGPPTRASSNNTTAPTSPDWGPDNPRVIWDDCFELAAQLFVPRQAVEDRVPEGWAIGHMTDLGLVVQVVVGFWDCQGTTVDGQPTGPATWVFSGVRAEPPEAFRAEGVDLYFLGLMTGATDPILVEALQDAGLRNAQLVDANVDRQELPGDLLQAGASANTEEWSVTVESMNPPPVPTDYQYSFRWFSVEDRQITGAMQGMSTPRDWGTWNANGVAITGDTEQAFVLPLPAFADAGFTAGGEDYDFMVWPIPDASLLRDG